MYSFHDSLSSLMFCKNPSPLSLNWGFAFPAQKAKGLV